MRELLDDNNFGMDNKGKADNMRNFVDIDNDVEPSTSKVPTEINIDSSVGEPNSDTNSDNNSA